MAKAIKPAGGSRASAASKKAAGSKPSGDAAEKSTPAETASAPKADTPKPEADKGATVAAQETKATDAKTTAKTPPADKSATEAKVVTAAPKADAKKPETPPAPEKKTADVPEAPPQKPTPPKPAEPEKSGSIFVPLVIGGIIAAGLGFFAAEMDFFGNRSQTIELQRSVSAQQVRLEKLEQAEPVGEFVEISAFDSLKESVAQFSEQISDLDTRITDFDTRLTAVEKRPISEGASTVAVDAYERELANLQASVEKQRAEIEGLLDNALNIKEATDDVARDATLQAALTQITTAISAGQPFEEPLAVLGENGVSETPIALIDAAAGVATLNNLQSRFPDSARAALASVRAEGGADDPAGFGGFLRRQLGARSVTPREGDGADAVLSRAEAAVRDGRLADAISDLEKLPQAGQDAMQDWLADARAQQAAQNAAKDLSQSLSAN